MLISVLPHEIIIKNAHISAYEGDVKLSAFFIKGHRRTRGHEVMLVKEQHRLDIRKCLLSQMTINEWSKLSTHCVNASSENM